MGDREIFAKEQGKAILPAGNDVTYEVIVYNSPEISIQSREIDYSIFDQNRLQSIRMNDQIYY